MADEEDMRDINLKDEEISEEQRAGTRQALADDDDGDGDEEDDS